MWAEILWDLRLFPGGSDGKVSVYNMRDLGLIPGLGRFPGEGNNNPLQSSCLENPMDCSLLGSPVHGIFQAIVLEWIAISFSSGSSRPRDRTRVSRIIDKHFTIWATREEGSFHSSLRVYGQEMNLQISKFHHYNSDQVSIFQKNESI